MNMFDWSGDTLSQGKIEVSKVDFKGLFSEQFWFVVPEYQRSYVWQTDNITELVEDLQYSHQHKPDNDYFLGSLVLKKLNESSFPEYEVLDGQQRLTTFFIMMAVLRDFVNHPQYKQTIHKKIYQEADKLDNIPARTRIVYKIRDDVEEFINLFLIKENGTISLEKIKPYLQADNVSLTNMANAITVFNEIFQSIAQDELEDFVGFVFKNAMFIYVSTDNTEDAFRMFTILNDRGIPLTNADILKSQNIGELKDQKEIKKYAQLWEEIEGKHGSDFDRFLQFIRTILVKDKSRSNLLEEFNEKVYKTQNHKNPKLQRGKDTFELIDKYNSIYENFIDLQDQTLSNDYKNLLTVMRIGLRSEDWIPPLMYYGYKYGTYQIDKFLKKLEYKFSGDWVCGISPTLRLDAMNTILNIIEITDISKIDELLNHPTLFMIDETAYKQIIDGSIYKRQFAKHLLLKIEYLKSDNTVHLSGYQHITVEHVLPQNPEENSQWVHDFSDENRINWTDRIANLVLLNQKKNSSLGNKDFQEKKTKYLKSKMDAFQANKVFIEQNSTWTPMILEHRQMELVNLLTSSV